MKSVAFHVIPKINCVFGLLLGDTMSPRTFKNRTTWSHCSRQWNIIEKRWQQVATLLHLTASITCLTIQFSNSNFMLILFSQVDGGLVGGNVVINSIVRWVNSINGNFLVPYLPNVKNSIRLTIKLAPENIQHRGKYHCTADLWIRPIKKSWC